MNTSNLTDTVNEIQISIPAYTVGFSTVSACFIGLSVLVYKYWHKRTPTHMFEFNVISDMLVFGLLGDVGLMAIQRYYKDANPFCFISNLLGLASW